jgi:hypothetical protein
MGKLTLSAGQNRDKSLFGTGTKAGQMAGQTEMAEICGFLCIGTKPGQNSGQDFLQAGTSGTKGVPPKGGNPLFVPAAVPLSQGGF